MAIRVIPDSEALAVTYLKAHASLVGLIPAIPATVPATARVSTELPPSTAVPYLTVTLLAGVEKDQGHLDEAYLDLNAWGGTKAEANLLIRTARAVMIDAHLATHTRGVVSNPRTVLPPRWLPDESVNPPRPRYVCSIGITIHPHPL